MSYTIFSSKKLMYNNVILFIPFFPSSKFKRKDKSFSQSTYSPK